MSTRWTLERGGVIPSAGPQPRAGRQPLRSVGGMIAGIVAVAFALTMSGGAAAAQVPSDSSPPSTPLEKIQALVQPAVVYEQITWTASVYDTHNSQYFSDTTPLTASFQCTGFVVNPDGYIGTAGHCVAFDDVVKQAFVAKAVDWAYANDYYKSLPSKETIATFASDWRFDGKSTPGQPDQAVSVAYGVSVSGEPSGKALPARVVGSRDLDHGDVALLKVDAKDLTVLPLSDNANTGVGTQIVSIGYPTSVDLVTDATYDPSFKEGSVSAKKTTSGGLYQVYEVSAPISGGMSGGPTASMDGKAIGVNSFMISGETQPFNFVQPSGTLSELMRAEGVDNSLGRVSDFYRAGITAYFVGDRAAAIEAFDQVIAIVPNHQFAQEYKRKAQDLPVSGFSLGSPIVKIGLAIVIILVLLVVAAVILFAIRRGKKGPSPTPISPVTPTPPYAPPPASAPAVTVAITPVATVPAPVADTPPEPSAVQVVPLPQPEAAAVKPEAAEDDPDLFCPNCGRQHTTDAHFCPHCGHVLK